MVDKTPNATVELSKLAVQIATLKTTKRLFIYGGARLKGDNGAFYQASRNVLKDYNNDLPVINYLITDGANTVINALKEQIDNTVQSLDLFCHGDPNGIYFVLGASLDKDVLNREYKPIASNIYAQWGKSIWRGYNDPEKKMKNQYAISNIKFSIFTNQSKIEIHGCNTGRGDDCFASELSIQFYKAGKKQGVVIAHTTDATPNIDGTTKITEQDYRHWTRVIFHNGKVIKTVTNSGRISANIIKEALGA